MRILFIICCLIIFPHLAYADSLNVAVAANLQFAFKEIQDAFKKETGHTIESIFGSSGKLASHIVNGAPFDVFLSADMITPQKLYEAGYAVSVPKTYANGVLVLWTMKDIDITYWRRLLKSANVRTIALANPKISPYGAETLRVLAYYQLDSALLSKLVYGDNITQTNQYIYSMAADVGFTAKSIVMSKEMQSQGKWIELPKESYLQIAQGAVILKYGQEKNKKVSELFYNFLYGSKVRTILEKNGYHCGNL